MTYIKQLNEKIYKAKLLEVQRKPNSTIIVKDF